MSASDFRSVKFSLKICVSGELELDSVQLVQLDNGTRKHQLIMTWFFENLSTKYNLQF